MAAQGVFIVSGYVIHVGLARYLGPARYGIYGVVISLLVWIEMAVINGIPTAVEKYVAEGSSVPHIRRQAIRIQLLYSGTVFILILALSPLLADILGDPRLGMYLRIAAFDLPVYALFYLYLGLINGMRDFGKRAIGMVVYALSKVTIILILVALGFSLVGAFVGNILASSMGFIAVLWLCTSYDSQEHVERNVGISKTVLIQFAIPIVLLTFCRQMLKNLDLLCVKALLRDDMLTGFYTSAVTIAKTPSFIFLALVFTLFPSLAKSIAIRDEEAARSYIRQALRFLFVLTIPLIFLVVPTAKDLVILMFSSAYEAAAPLLSVLIIGWIFSIFLMALMTIMVADNRPYQMVLLSLIMMALDLLLIFKLIPVYGVNGAAWATTITDVISVLVVATFVFLRFKVLVAPATIIRVIVGSVIIYAMISMYQAPHFFLLLEYILLFSVYLIILYLIREITFADMSTLVSGLLRKVDAADR
jgi:stage V sporulation protein B